MSPAILHRLLRDQWQYDGVLITDGMDMHAIAGRYGVGHAAVCALLAGADMVMALGNTATQLETLTALTEVIWSGQISLAEIERKLARIRALTEAYPCAAAPYQTELADHLLMSQAWRRGLTAIAAPQAPARNSKVRLLISADVISDGVSEAGISAAQVTAMLASLYDVDTVTFERADEFDWHSLPADGRTVILASTVRIRYSERVRQSWKPALHLVLWNPFQVLDIDAPALLSYGFAQPALDAMRAWLAGEITAAGQLPVATCAA